MIKQLLALSLLFPACVYASEVDDCLATARNRSDTCDGVALAIYEACKSSKKQGVEGCGDFLVGAMEFCSEQFRVDTNQCLVLAQRGPKIPSQPTRVWRVEPLPAPPPPTRSVLAPVPQRAN